MLKVYAEIKLIGVNPYVSLPESILQQVFLQAGKNKGPIAIDGTVNGRNYKQTLVKYAGEWRLYINTAMLRNSPKRIGETIEVTIKYDPRSRVLEPSPDFLRALAENKEAKAVFSALSASRRAEIVRYLANLKTETARERNIKRAVNFLLGKERFVGRDKP